jgi:hypothetical protein
MATDLNACRPSEGEDVLNRLTGLRGPLLQIDLEAELSQLRQEDSLQRETGRSSITIAKYPDLRVVLILMKGGSRMRQHRAEGRISIQQLKGRTRIHLDTSRKMDLCAGHLLVLDCGVLHDVEALDESALLLTICWRKADTSTSVSSTEQQLLDEEAKSRMNDEGGTSGTAVEVPPRFEGS